VSVVSAKETPNYDVHVVLGPHYAMREHIGKDNVIMLDRCFYGDPEDKSLVARVGWLNADGSLRYARRTARQGPPVQPWRYSSYRRCLVLADYNQPVMSIAKEAQNYFQEVKVRLHPANGTSPESLACAIQWADVVIGTAGTALIQAILVGVPTTCLDPRHIARPVTSYVIGTTVTPDRTLWLRRLADTQWSHSEMQSGLMWEHLYDDKLIIEHRANYRTGSIV
jgi:hypothetical protein